MPIIITWDNNVYGPRQYLEKLVAKSCVLLSQKSLAYIQGSGDHPRNYVFVIDMAEACDVIMHSGNVGSVYNVGSDEEKTNLQVVRDCVLASRLEDPSNPNAYITFVKDREVNEHHYCIDFSKLKILGWTQKVSWEQGIRNTVAWYLDECNLEGWPDYKRGLVAHPTHKAAPDEVLLWPRIIFLCTYQGVVRLAKKNSRYYTCNTQIHTTSA
ncbi:hypothetical protein BWQ96_06635 [Gracilariopsis chorda]|uniref:NAD(P)-binding domain-containing protein n=1 Tax=Gracilariopsis chorda TaxID=448386 RepID=A0A2V3INH0_9FLOR|nr:hypothetical protein BWQ96_06635 [Gracilariopsis chorda]|eukprot:PXF43626.1 hypothetical protein BWQ96_06635 [Gracilariopsis chorda]